MVCSAEDGAVVAGEDLDVAFVVVVAVGEEAGDGAGVAGDAGPDADGGVVDVCDGGFDLGG